jgi:transcriptional regulator with XRE-family HTH domain
MKGLEYILKLNHKSLDVFAKEIGLKEHEVTPWFENNNTIPEQYLPVLSTIFDLPEDYFEQQIPEETVTSIDQQRKKFLNAHNELIQYELEKDLLLKKVDALLTVDMGNFKEQKGKKQLILTLYQLLTTACQSDYVDLHHLQNHLEKLIEL